MAASHSNKNSSLQPTGLPVRPAVDADIDQWRKYAVELEAIAAASEHRANFLQTRLNRLITSSAWKLLKKAKGVVESLINQAPADPRKALLERYQDYRKLRKLTDLEKNALHRQVDAIAAQNSIKLAMNCANAKASEIKHTLESLRNNIYQNWELCLFDCSVDIPLDSQVRRCTQHDFRVTPSEFIARISPGDVLYPEALATMTLAILQHPTTRIIYSDDELLQKDGRYFPRLKPDWSPDMFWSHPDYLGQLCLIRGGLNPIETAETIQSSEVIHIPRVLCTIRKEHAETQLSELQESLHRRGIEARVEPGAAPGLYTVRRKIQQQALVSILIPFRDGATVLRTCLNSIRKHTAYKNYELILIDNGSTDKATLKLVDTEKTREDVKVLRIDEPFNYSRLINRGADAAGGDYLLLLNNDIEAIEADWLGALLEHGQRSEVGAVGAKLLYPDRRMQHAGVVIGRDDIAAHPYRLLPENDPGIDGSPQMIRNYSAVTGACLLTRRKLFVEIGGLDERNLPVAYSDIDYCLRLREKNLLIVYTPCAKLIHHESISRGFANNPQESAYMCRRWARAINSDPYDNAILKTLV